MSLILTNYYANFFHIKLFCTEKKYSVGFLLVSSVLGFFTFKFCMYYVVITFLSYILILFSYCLFLRNFILFPSIFCVIVKHKI
jgi:hypothetical protein